MAEPAREEILRRVRTALHGAPQPAPIPRDYDRHRDLGDVLALAAERLADYHAVVHRVSTVGLSERIGTILRGRGLRRMATPADLPVTWQPGGFEWQRDEPPLDTPALDGCDGVLTGCAVTIAETGTVVLDTGAAQGRRALTLVPDYHLCVVLADQVVTTVPEALARLEPTRPLTMISGPSATSDIELDRIEGVHGPRTLEVLLTDPTGEDSPP